MIIKKTCKRVFFSSYIKHIFCNFLMFFGINHAVNV